MPDADYQPRLFPASSRADSVEEGVRVVWVFGRDSAQLRVAHIQDERLLVVARPDEPVMQRRFATIEALVDFQTELEGQLRREGWTLKHVEPDRRSHADRRRGTRAGRDRRRDSDERAT
jgi:hypothetical protein